MTLSPKKPKFSQEADALLEQLYESVGATSVEQKVATLKACLPKSNFYAFGGTVTPAMMLGCLEYEYLSEKGKIDLEFV